MFVGYAVGLGLCGCIQAFLHQQFFFRSTRIGMQQRNAVSALIYKTILSLHTTAFIQTTTGSVVNLVAIETSKFEEVMIFSPYIIMAPIEAAIIFGLIWIDLGIPTLFGRLHTTDIFKHSNIIHSVFLFTNNPLYVEL